MSSWLLDVERLVSELRRQKQKYHAKTLSTSGINVLFLRMLDLGDLFPFYVWLHIPEFDFAALAMSLLYDLPPITVEPINVEFEVDLPDLSELLQGILADVQPVDLSELYDWLKSVDDMLRANLEAEAAEGIIATRIRKGVYGETSYDMSYYDPPAVREFLRSTLPRMFLERRTHTQLRRDFEAAARETGLHETHVRYVFNRLSMLLAAQAEVFILGYGVLGVSKLARTASDLAVTRFVDYDGNVVEAKISALDHLQYGFILGVTPLGFGVLLPARTVYRKPETETVTGAKTRGSPPAVRLIEHKARRLIRTFRWNAFTLANYNRPDEQQSYLRSERADQWAELQMLRYTVEHMVDPIIRAYESSPVRIRAYKSAALQLVAIKAKRHRWGYRGFQAMTDEELYRWWRSHWEAQGLNPQVLDQIYERLKPVLQHVRWEKWRRGLRVRLRRYSLALSSPSPSASQR